MHVSASQAGPRARESGLHVVPSRFFLQSCRRAAKRGSRKAGNHTTA
ncbi:hypothetical protein E2C01_069727 [Portunus trituberculatus]|uniref:Uncharacterized protein n=1 Tax=Portunus trituberculatus TaxID=210409 RepID=A0A5B7HQT2_PORTR|nr:hypothetical protein [Portunus trituberculatus]